MATHPFDARREFLIDKGLPRGQWRVVSLVSGLRGTFLGGLDLHPHPEADDTLWYRAVRVIADELTLRGIDGDSLIRYGFAPEIIGRVFTVVLPSWREQGLLSSFPPEAPDGDGSAATLMPPSAPEAWVALLASPAPLAHAEDEDFATEARRLLRGLVMTVWPWIMTAPIDDLIMLRPPTEAQVQDAVQLLATDHVATEVLDQYRWIVERFSFTHLSEWSTSSLHLEYRWMQGEEAAPCRDAVMSDRDLELVELQAEIARRASSPNMAELETWPTGVERSLTSKVYDQALERLREGRYLEAATLFEFACSQAPSDPNAFNNLGFCLMPFDPERARRELLQAAKLGYDFPAINIYNQALCHYMQGRPRDCLALMEDQWVIVERGPRSRSASLWIEEGGKLQLAEDVDPLTAITQFAKRVAEQLGQDEVVRTWASRES